jgi:sulfite exporter TauE/SafE
VAGSTGGVLAGAVVMAVFWVGTVPILLAIAVGAARLLGPLTRRLPVISATFVLVLGLLTIAMPGAFVAERRRRQVLRRA